MPVNGGAQFIADALILPNGSRVAMNANSEMVTTRDVQGNGINGNAILKGAGIGGAGATAVSAIAFYPTSDAFFLVDLNIKNDVIRGFSNGDRIRKVVRLKPGRVSDRFWEPKHQLPSAPSWRCRTSHRSIGLILSLNRPESRQSYIEKLPEWV